MFLPAISITPRPVVKTFDDFNLASEVTSPLDGFAHDFSIQIELESIITLVFVDGVQEEPSRQGQSRSNILDPRTAPNLELGVFWEDSAWRCRQTRIAEINTWSCCSTFGGYRLRFQCEMNLRLALTLLEACEENFSYYRAGDKRHDKSSRLPKDTMLNF